MIRTRLHLQAREDAQQILDFYLERGILDRSNSQPGCLSVEIGVSSVDADRVTVSALWESKRAYLDWLDHPDRADDAAALLPLIRQVGRESQAEALGETEITQIMDLRSAPRA